MLGTIAIEQLQCECIVGILERERKQKQVIFLDIAMQVDFTAAAKTESIVETLDYTQVSHSIIELIQVKKFQLIETMAVECLQYLMSSYPKLHSASIAIAKPKALEGLAKCPRVNLKVARGQQQLIWGLGDGSYL